MKKSLLSICALSVAAIAGATIDEPFIMPSSYIMGFSPDKTVAIGEYFGNVYIHDLTSDEAPKIFEASEDGLTYNSCGLGNFIGNNTLCASRGSGHAVEAYLWGKTGVLNGRFVSITNEVKGGLGSSNGVTPDGTRICGNNPTGEEFGIEAENTMVVPAVWERNGNTFTRTLLPCPTKDYLGLNPQYVTALSISDDGKTVIGQLVSNNGFLTEFVVYNQAEDGTWSYRKPFDSLVNPNKLEIPEYPGEGPEIPTLEKYMSEEQYDAYLAALEEYNANPDGNVEPNYKDYMTEEEYAAFMAVYIPYLEWLEKYDEYERIDTQIRNESISFEFNLNSLSPNGRYLASSAVETYFMGFTRVSKYTPVLYDLVEDRIIFSDGPDIRVTAVSNNGDVLGFTRDMINGLDLGYVLPAGATEWMPLQDYIVMRNPSVAQWIEDNWKREVELVVDPIEYVTEFQTLYVTGMPMISRDFTLLSTVAFNYWEDNDLPNDYNSYIIPLVESDSAIEEIENVDNANAPVEYFNLQGVRISEPENGVFIRRQGSDVSKIRK